MSAAPPATPEVVFERLMDRIAQALNSSLPVQGERSITAMHVKRAVESLESDGYAFEYVTVREELISQRLLRLGLVK